MNNINVLKDKVLAVLKNVYDPEIPIDIVDLGLVYEIKVDDGNVYIKMTLTTPGCPLWKLIAQQVKDAVKSIEGVEDIKVDLVWDPPWSPDKMSPELKEELGL